MKNQKPALFSCTLCSKNQEIPSMFKHNRYSRQIALVNLHLLESRLFYFAKHPKKFLR